jgi:hypothetical protein
MVESFDVTRRDDAPYWAAILVMAVRSRNKVRMKEAQSNLRRLGVTLTVGAPRNARKAARHV